MGEMAVGSDARMCRLATLQAAAEEHWCTSSHWSLCCPLFKSVP